MLKVGVLGSTKGTDLQAIIDAISKKELTNVEISVVISNKEAAYILERARENDIEAVFISQKDKSREEFDEEAVKVFEEKKVDVVLLIGYMRIVTKVLIDKYRNKIVNVHPSLLPKFSRGMDKDVHQAVLNAGEKESGCTVHIVTEDVDAGPIISQAKVKIEDEENADSLKAKVQKEEGRLLVETLKLYRDGKIKVVDGKVVK